MRVSAQAVLAGTGNGETHEAAAEGVLTGLPGGNGFALQAVFCNRTGAPVRLRRIVLADWRVVCAGNPAQWRLTRLGADFDDGIPGSGQARDYMDYLALYPQEAGSQIQVYPSEGTSVLFAGPGLLAGAAGADGGPQADVRIHCRFGGPAGFAMRICSEHSDVIIASGAACASETVWLLTQSWGDAVERLMHRLAGTHGARLGRGPVFGWCSWYHKGTAIAGQDIADCAEDAARRRETLPMQVIQIDDGHQRAFGDWRLNDKFKGGWPPLLDRIARAGAMPGIWLAPLAVQSHAPVYTEHPEWFQQDAQGQVVGSLGGTRYLDPTHPGARDFLRELIRRHRQAGFGYFKFDFNILHDETRFHDPSRTRIQVLRDLFLLYRGEIGEDAYLLACMCGFTRAVAGIADAVRIGVDSMAVWQESHGICISRCVQAVGATAAANGVLFVNDPDVTYTWPHRLTDAEWRTWHSFAGLLGGTTMISEPLCVGLQRLGHVRCRLAPASMGVHADITDIAPCENPAMPWEGSCVEVFVLDARAGIQQYFLLAGQALRVREGHIVPAPEVSMRRAERADGYSLDAEIPVMPLADGLVRVEVRVYATVDRRYGLAYACLFGSRMPYQDTGGYGTLRAGDTAEGDLALPDIGATARQLEILNPPLPCGARSFSGGADPWHPRFGYLLDGAANILLWNVSGATADVPLSVPAVTEALGPRFHAWSFWEERYLGVSDGTFRAESLPPHGPALLRLTALRDAPVVVGSTLHITMGTADVESVDWTGAELTVRLTDAGAREGCLFIVCGGTPVLCRAEGLQVACVTPEDGCWTIAIQARRRGEPQAITLRIVKEQC
jgi:hypothetical protein